MPEKKFLETRKKNEEDFKTFCDFTGGKYLKEQEEVFADQTQTTLTCDWDGKKEVMGFMEKNSVRVKFRDPKEKIVAILDIIREEKPHEQIFNQILLYSAKEVKAGTSIRAVGNIRGQIDAETDRIQYKTFIPHELTGLKGPDEIASTDQFLEFRDRETDLEKIKGKK